MSTGERSYFTKNRRGEPATTLMDEFLDGRPTGAVVSGYTIHDGRAVSHYVAQEPSPVPAGGYMSGTDEILPLPEPPVEPGYIGVTRGLEEEPRPAVVEAIRQGTRITSELVQAAARTIADLHPLHLEPLEVRGERGKPIHVHEHTQMTTVYILEFDGPYGVESKEFLRISDAQEYPQVLRDYFKRDCFNNFRLFRESRSAREQLSFGE